MNINWQVAAAISEVIGAVAVVISLIYLAYQVRQNTRAIRGSTLDAITDHMQDELRWSAEIGHIWRKVFEAPDTLTFEESWQLGEWTNAAFTARQNEYHQYCHGLLDKEVWLASENIIRLLVSLDWVREWWERHARNDRSAGFVDLVDRLIAEDRRSAQAEIEAVIPSGRSGAGDPA